MPDMSIDNPDYAKAAGVLKDVLPEGTDPMKVWEALKSAGLTITESATPDTPPEDEAATTPTGIPPEAAPSGAPIEGEPSGVGAGPAGMNAGDIGTGPPTDDLILKAFQSAQAEHAKK